MSDNLPILALRDEFERLDSGRVVISASTGSGKSTQVPRWCTGRVLVVEPRRVACRTLAQRVAELEGSVLGNEVGYQVRDERRAGAETRILFATPGIAIHSTFWHNNFGGEYMSHGCVNVLADDAKWIWRWTLPVVPYDAIEVRETWLGENLTEVRVIEF